MAEGGSFGRGPDNGGGPQRRETHNRARSGGPSGAGSGEQPVRGPHDPDAVGPEQGILGNRDHLPRPTTKQTLRFLGTGAKRALQGARAGWGQGRDEAIARNIEELHAQAVAPHAEHQQRPAGIEEHPGPRWPDGPGANSAPASDRLDQTISPPVVNEVGLEDAREREDQPMPTTLDTLRFIGSTLLGGLRGARAGMRQGMHEANDRRYARVRERTVATTDTRDQNLSVEAVDQGRLAWPDIPADRTAIVEGVDQVTAVPTVDSEIRTVAPVGQAPTERDNYPMPTTLDTLRFLGSALLGGLRGVRPGMRQGRDEANNRYSVRVDQRAAAAQRAEIQGTSTRPDGENGTAWPDIQVPISAVRAVSADPGGIEALAADIDQIDAANPGENTMTLNLVDTPNYKTPDGIEDLKYNEKPIKGFISIGSSDDVYVLSIVEGRHQTDRRRVAMLTKIDQETQQLDPHANVEVRREEKPEPVIFQTAQGPIEVQATIGEDGRLHLVAPDNQRIYVQVSPGTRVDDPQPQEADS